MKRTLTAAVALVASSTGVVGLAGTASAAAPSFPDNLPVDNSMAQTVFHAAGTMHSAKGVVGDVLPLERSLGARSEGPAEAPPGHHIGNPIGALLSALGGGDSVQDAVQGVGNALPAPAPAPAPAKAEGPDPAGTLPAPLAGNPQSGSPAGMLGDTVSNLVSHGPLGGLGNVSKPGK